MEHRTSTDLHQAYLSRLTTQLLESGDSQRTLALQDAINFLNDMGEIDPNRPGLQLISSRQKELLTTITDPDSDPRATSSARIEADELEKAYQVAFKKFPTELP